MTNTNAAARTQTLSDAIHAARYIVRGDVSTARMWLAGRKWGASYRVCEARALFGAVAEANRRYGCSLDAREIMGWT